MQAYTKPQALNEGSSVLGKVIKLRSLQKGLRRKLAPMLQLSLAVLLLVTCFNPLIDTALAFSGAGTGTELDPYIITNCVQLQEMEDDLDAYYELGNNIDCSDTVNWNSGSGFDPVGDYVDDIATTFQGVFNGKGYTISDLIIIRANDTPDDWGAPEDESNVGLFGYAYGASVENVHIRDSKIKGYYAVGGIVGYLDGGTISSSTVNTTTPDNDCNGSTDRCVWARYGTYGGGIVGAASSSAVISNVKTAGPVRGSGNYIGGLAGRLENSTMTDGYTSSDTDGGQYIGGAFGDVYGSTVTNVHATGDAHAALDESAGKGGRIIGGFAGQIYGSTVSQSSASGSTSADAANVGGFVGYTSDSTITDSFATGSVTSDSVYAGGFAGHVYSSVLRSYASGSVSGDASTVSAFSGTMTADAADTSQVSDSFSISSIDSPSTAGAMVGYLQNEYGFAENNPLTNVYYDQTQAGETVCYGRAVSGTAEGELYYPPEIAIDSLGNVYVANSRFSTGASYVDKLDSSGNFLFRIGGATGSGNGQLYDVAGIAIDSADNVYIADQANYRIQKFDSSGNYVTKWGSAGSGNGQFNYPSGIAIDAADNVYVSEAFSNKRIQKFTSSGVYVTKWGSAGSGNSQFQNITGIATDSSNNVYTTDSTNNRVQKFDSAGTYVTQWGSVGTGDGQFNTPMNIAVDSSNNIYVVEQNNYRVQKFTNTGTFTTKWGGTQGSDPSEFSLPWGIAVSPADEVYVADTYNQRMQIFNASGVYQDEWSGVGTTTGSTGCTAVNTDGNDDDYFFDPTNEPFAGSWDQDVWYFSGSALPVLCEGDCSIVTQLTASSDYDEDGVTNGIEDAAPSNGDGNGDSVPDSLQLHVSSFVGEDTGEYITLVTPAGTTITESVSVTATVDPDFTYPFGFIGFTLTGLTPGDTAEITILYHNASSSDTDSLQPRKYFPETQTFLDLEDYTVTATTVDANPAIQLTYSLTDGSTYDLDGAADGSITDPVALGVSIDSDGEGLADTGADSWILLTFGVSLAALGLALRRNKTNKPYKARV